MATEERFDLVVVGGGAGGLSAARAGVRRGRRTALVQEGRLGGDCTFTGCVPSKTLIEAAARGGTLAGAISLVHEVIEQIAATESAEVLAGEGVTVIEGRGRFVGARTLEAAGRLLRADRVVIATGSAPLVPPIPGLDTVPFHTNETVFDLERPPTSMVVLGGGAIGCELAQAFCRLGVRTEIVEAVDRLLAREEPEASAAVAGALGKEGVVLHLGATVARVRRRTRDEGVLLELVDGRTVEADQLLVATGRRPVTDGLDPRAGGVALDRRGAVATDRYLRTSAHGVYAIGDVTGRLAFTHAADEMGRLAVRNAFSPLRRRTFDARSIPVVTFTDPEVARVGPTESEVDGQSARVACLPMRSVDRALAAQRTEGFVKLIAGPRPVLGNAGGGRLLGATVVSPRAGETIHEAALAMRTGMFTGRLAQTVHAYPTWSLGLRQAAAQFFSEVDGRRARPVGSAPASERPAGPAPSGHVLGERGDPGQAVEEEHAQGAQ
ncbi:MAG: FAD-dependent oxidoreductase [Actinomycetota bacterium]|nr:FAD-dependent oxidoreductase [Actinomycetota bacterium]